MLNLFIDTNSISYIKQNTLVQDVWEQVLRRIFGPNKDRRLDKLYIEDLTSYSASNLEYPNQRLCDVQIAAYVGEITDAHKILILTCKA
jgi:hypothetical protein